MQPIETTSLTLKDRQQLTEQVRVLIAEALRTGSQAVGRSISA
jgi:hypothetical protein